MFKRKIPELEVGQVWLVLWNNGVEKVKILELSTTKKFVRFEWGEYPLSWDRIDGVEWLERLEHLEEKKESKGNKTLFCTSKEMDQFYKEQKDLNTWEKGRKGTIPRDVEPGLGEKKGGSNIHE